MPDETAAMPQATEPITPQVSASTRSQLVAAFTANPDAIQVDNSKEAAPDAVAEVKAEDTPNADEKPPAEEPKPNTEAKQEEELPTADAEADETDEDEGSEKKYLSKEEIDEKFARVPKNARSLLASYSEDARKGVELRSKLGGEPFIEPITKIANGLQAENANVQSIFEGVLEARGEDGLLPLLAHAVSTTFLNADDKSEFGYAMTLIRDAAVKDLFGAELNVERIQKLAEWEQMGWFDTLQKWTEAGAVDEDELLELIEVNNNPRLKTLAAQNAELKRQLEANKSQARQPDNSKESEVENGFAKFSDDQISTVLTDTIWRNSPLKDIATDTPEIKEEKEFERSRLKGIVMDKFQKSPEYKKLLEAAKLQKSGTAHWQASFVNLVKSTIDQTANDKKRSEEHIKKLYGESRNGKLAAAAKPKAEPSNGATSQPEKLQPTVSQPLIAPDAARTPKDTRNTLREAFRALEGTAAR